MAETIVDGTLFNVENVRYSSPKVNQSGGKSVNILNSDTKTGLRLSTPLMLTWGASDFEGNEKFEMSLQFPKSEYTNDDCEAFLKNMQDFENKIKADALKNSKDWFGKVHKNSEVVDALYTPMLKYSKDKFTGEPDLTKPPVLRVKLSKWEGAWKCLICDEDGQKLFPNQLGTTPLDYIKKGTNLAVIMQCGGLWFANGKFGVTWKLIQAMVQKPKASLLDECLIRLKPSDRERLKASPPVDPNEDTDTQLQGTIVEDSDDEEEVVPPPVPQPEPVQEDAVADVPSVVAPKKVKVVKKKAVSEA
jgi:Family of unknown function (DUF5871)